MAFCLATCSECREQFRLVWRIGKRKLPPSTAIRLTCPACGHCFEQVAVGLVVYSAGREQFPNSVVVGKSAILARRPLNNGGEAESPTALFPS